MGKLHLYIFAVSLVLFAMTFLPNISSAQDQAKKPAIENVAGDTRIEVDDENDMIRYFIKGEEVMRLDDRGLFVKYELQYGTVLVDVGPMGFPAVKEGIADEK